MSKPSDAEAHVLLGAELQREAQRCERLRLLLLRCRYEDVGADAQLQAEIDAELFGPTDACSSNVAPGLLDVLRRAGDEWGPLGVAKVAADLVGRDVLVRELLRPSTNSEDRSPTPTSAPTPGGEG